MENQRPDADKYIPNADLPFSGRLRRQLPNLLLLTINFAILAKSCTSDRSEKPYKSPDLLEIEKKGLEAEKKRLETEKKRLEAEKGRDERARTIERAKHFCGDSTLGESAILGERIGEAFIYDGMEEVINNETLLCGDILGDTPGSAELQDHCLEAVRRAQGAIRSACESYHRRVPTVCNTAADGKMESKQVRDIPKLDPSPGSTQTYKPDPVYKADRNK